MNVSWNHSKYDKPYFAAEGEFIYFSKVRLNCRNIEDALQEKIDHCPLGIKLHRARSCGGNFDDDYAEPGYLCKTFITSFPVTGEIEGSSMRLNDRKVKIIRWEVENAL